MRSKPQTPRAGRQGNGGLAVIRISTGLDVARRRGPRVHRDPGVPRALGSFRGEGGKEMQETAYPGPLIIRAMTHVWAIGPSSIDPARPGDNRHSRQGLPSAMVLTQN